MKMLCKVCEAAARCRRTFRKFWLEKSHGGVGCDHPLKPIELPGESKAKSTVQNIEQGEFTWRQHSK